MEQVNWMQLAWTTLAFILSMICTTAVMVWNFRNYVDSTKKSMKDEFDAKLGKMWERFDIHKGFCETTFIRHDTCDLTHAGTKESLMANKLSMDELKVDIKSIGNKLDSLILSLVKEKHA